MNHVFKICTDGNIYDFQQQRKDIPLRELQQAVGGYIECARSVVPGVILVINEEGKNMGLPFNSLATSLFLNKDYDYISGTCIVATIKNENICALSESQYKKVLKSLPIVKAAPNIEA